MIYRQDTPAAHWEIEHGFRTNPIVMAFDSDGNALVPHIEYVDDNNLRLHFSHGDGRDLPVAGYARLV